MNLRPPWKSRIILPHPVNQQHRRNGREIHPSRRRRATEDAGRRLGNETSLPVDAGAAPGGAR
jgi:hypothetical protein